MNRLFYLFAVVLLFNIGAVNNADAQSVPMVNDPPAQGVTGYSDVIPIPDEVLGYLIGEKHTRPHLIVEYFQRIAGISDRVEYGEHGRSYDGRKLVHSIITSPHNHNRIDDIKEFNKKLSTDPGSMTEADLEDMPAVVWMGYGVHGNEASSFEAAMLLLYHLAAGEGEHIENILNDLVILLIPSLNPDGHARHGNWVNANRGSVPTTDPQHREHNEPWPGGRTNYYWFDLNRDWFPVQHPESIGRIQLYNEWRPQLVTDYHEFGSNSTYFFQPGVPSRYNPHIPGNSIDLLKEVGEYHATALDERGALYYTRETFDDFYIGKGSTYPMVSGAIGILFEQASSRALKRETRFGTLTFDFTILNQFTTSLSTLDACYSLREELLQNQREFYIEANEYARQKGVRAYIIDKSSDRTVTQELFRIMNSHRVSMYDLDNDVTVDGTTFQANQAIVIPTEQPEARFIFAAFEQRTEFTDSVFYDISTWSLPLAFNLPYAEYRQDPANLLGSRLEEFAYESGGINGGRASYAYVLEWNRYYAPRALHRLHSNEVTTIAAMRPFTTMVNGEEREFSRGSIVIPVRQQEIDENELYDLLQDIVTNDHVTVHSLESSRTIDGPDLGSPAMRVLTKPEVAIISGSGTSSYEVGEAWHLLNERMNMPVTLLNVDAIDDADLDRYTTLVMVHGNYNTLSDPGAENILEWVRRGGVLITTKNATRLAAERELIDLEIIESENTIEDVRYEDMWIARGADRIGGAIFEAHLDTSHPIAYGYEERVPLFRNHMNFYSATNGAGQTVAEYTDSPLMSGYISDDRLEELRNTVAIIAQRSGSGRVVAFADNPNFRAFWFGTNRLFLNAIFFGSIF